MPPTISVIIATYNRPALVQDAVHSILRQTFQDLELIVCNDASTDETAQILDALASTDSRVRIITLAENRGCFVARNTAIEAASGEYIAILDDDDIAVPDRLEKQLQIFRDDPAVDFVSSSLTVFDVDGTLYRDIPLHILLGDFRKTGDKVFEDLYLRRVLIADSTTMVRAALIKKTVYPISKHGGGDTFLFLKYAAMGSKFGAVAEPLVLLRRGIEHKSMSASLEALHDDQQSVFRNVRAWLREEGITRFDHLHHTADAVHLLYAARDSRGPERWAFISQLIRNGAYLSLAWEILLIVSRLLRWRFYNPPFGKFDQREAQISSWLRTLREARIEVGR